MKPLSFEGRVAIVTGAGGGIGRAHALALAGRGASVVVNDRGVSLDGREMPISPGAAVVSEIEASGGAAVLSTHSVANIDGPAAIVGLATEAFGRVDIVINNAGIFHYANVQNVTMARFQDMLDVHVLGPFLVTQAAWPHFLRQGYGRVLMTCSSAGLFGLDAGIHYSAAKAALIGLTRSLALEGAGHGIQVNAIAPGASTRSSQDGLSGPFLDWFSKYFTPESVAAAATWLVHESCPDSGQIYAAQGGRVARVTISEGPGYFSLALSPEDVRDNHELARREDEAVVIRGMREELDLTFERLVEAGAPEPPPMTAFQLTSPRPSTPPS
jgi:NAD(P)-dependent dehydrogenase (short-subunit alcohol dehydrogenase family)